MILESLLCFHSRGLKDIGHGSFARGLHFEPFISLHIEWRHDDDDDDDILNGKAAEDGHSFCCHIIIHFLNTEKKLSDTF